MAYALPRGDALWVKSGRFDVPVLQERDQGWLTGLVRGEGCPRHPDGCKPCSAEG